MTDKLAFHYRCRSVTFEEADDRLAAGWHVDLPEPGPMCSAQRKRYLRLERERLVQQVALHQNRSTALTLPAATG